MAEIIRVLQVFGLLDMGGAENMMMNVYRNIDRTRVQFDFVEHTNKHCYFEDEIESMGGKIYHAPSYTIINHLSYRRWWEEFFKEHDEHSIVHGHMYTISSIYLGVAKKHGKFTIVHSHCDSNGLGIKARIKDLYKPFTAGSADVCLACSDDAGRWLYGEKVIQSDKYHFFPNGIEISDFTYDEVKRNKIRKEYGISENALVVGTVGRLTPQKNPTGIIEILKALNKIRTDDWRFVWVGTGELLDFAREEVERYGLSDRVVFTGVRHDIGGLLSAMDVFILPSNYEGLGIVGIEAQTNGLSCLFSDAIPRQVDVTGEPEFLSLSDYVTWADRIDSLDKKRYDKVEKVRAAGFDIKKSSEWLQNLYLGLAK